MKGKYRAKAFSIQGKMTLIVLAANLLVFIVNVVLLAGINNMSDRMDLVYQDNLYLNELTRQLDLVQSSMTEYLDIKTSDALEDYYRAADDYNKCIEELDSSISNETFERMERNIRNMSEMYLQKVSQTIEAKRGRNVERYRTRYEEATELYGYIKTIVYSLNTEQFKENSSNYSSMLQAFDNFERSLKIVMIVVIIGNVLIIARLTYEVVRPLKDLTIVAQEVAKGNFEIEPLPVTSSDEVGVVTRAFNSMVESIRQYVVQIKKSMETEQQLREKELMITAHLKDAQLKYLQAQINPHFLFNTLNAGAQLAMMEEADRTYEYLQHMAEFFRYNVKKADKTVTVREEVELIDNYVYILNVRFSGDIHYEKQIDSSLLEVEMPSMILQPIVENCVNHGIRDMMGEGRITLKVYRIDDVVCISISDNGRGMTQETIDNILLSGRDELKKATGANGIGMDNVVARLRLFCNCDDPLSIISEGENCGTEFIIYLDFKEKREYV